MHLTENLKSIIDGMSYESMLSKWRNSPSRNPIFQGESGDYFAKIMKKKREDERSAKYEAENKVRQESFKATQDYPVIMKALEMICKDTNKSMLDYVNKARQEIAK